MYGEVELWTTDEHRIGLKPILRKVWAPKGQRPHLAVYPRYEWLYLYAFVRPQTGETEWFIMPYLNTKAFQAILELFVKTRNKHILLVMDRAPWHISGKLEVPLNLSILHQPAYSPELQPAEHLWQFSDEVLVNQCFDSIDKLELSLAKQCKKLQAQSQKISSATLFHWWPLT